MTRRPTKVYRQVTSLNYDTNQASGSYPRPQPVEALYRIRDVADILGVHPRTVARIIAQGRLEVLRLTERSVRVTGKAIREYLHNSANPAGHSG